MKHTTAQSDRTLSSWCSDISHRERADCLVPSRENETSHTSPCVWHVPSLARRARLTRELPGAASVQGPHRAGGSSRDHKSCSPRHPAPRAARSGATGNGLTGPRQVGFEGQGRAQTQSVQPGGRNTVLCISHPLGSLGIRVRETVRGQSFGVRRPRRVHGTQRVQTLTPFPPK